MHESKKPPVFRERNQWVLKSTADSPRLPEGDYVVGAPGGALLIVAAPRPNRGAYVQGLAVVGNANLIVVIAVKGQLVQVTPGVAQIAAGIVPVAGLGRLGILGRFVGEERNLPWVLGRV